MKVKVFIKYMQKCWYLNIYKHITKVVLNKIIISVCMVKLQNLKFQLDNSLIVPIFDFDMPKHLILQLSLAAFLTQGYRLIFKF